MDSILSVRINEEVKEKFIKLAEEQGVNNKEFLDLIIKNYEINKVTADIDFVRNDVEELQGIIKRILDIYINVIDKSKIKNKELINNFSLSLKEERERADSINAEIISLKKEIENLKETNKNLKSSNENLKESISKEKESLKELREMNLILKDKLHTFTEFKEENEVLKTEKSTLQEASKALEKELQESLKISEKYKVEKEHLNNKLEELKLAQTKELEQLRNSYTSQLKLKENEFSIMLQKELLQKEQELRQGFWELQSNYDSKISLLLKEKEDLIFKISSLSQK